MARASDLHSECRRFEPCSVYQFERSLMVKRLFVVQLMRDHYPPFNPFGSWSLYLYPRDINERDFLPG